MKTQVQVQVQVERAYEIIDRVKKAAYSAAIERGESPSVANWQAEDAAWSSPEVIEARETLSRFSSEAA